jgi:hypothetical protein
MLRVRFGKAAITGAAHAKGTHPLRNRRFDPLSQSILAGKCWRLLPTTGGLERFMLGLRSDRDGPPLVLLCRADTVDLARTATAIFCGELDLDHLIGSVVAGRSPTDTAVSDRGQIACWHSQSMRNWLASMPCSVLAYHFTSPRAGPITSIPYCCRLLTRMGAVI